MFWFFNLKTISSTFYSHFPFTVSTTHGFYCWYQCSWLGGRYSLPVVCLKETSKSTVIEYGKSQGTTEFGDVFLTMIDTDHPLFVRLYSFGNGEEPLEIVDAHIISRHLTKANCRGGTVHDNQTNMCVQHCHELCDPSQGKNKLKIKQTDFQFKPFS